MGERKITKQVIEQFQIYLRSEEKSLATMEKYIRDVRAFCEFAAGREVSKELMSNWKDLLQKNSYAPRSINSMLASMNSLLSFIGWNDCKVKNIRTQRQIYSLAEKELSKSEYKRLLVATGADCQLKLIMETICSTGIRVSELRHFTVEAIKQGQIEISCKGKIRTVLLPSKLRKLLMVFARKSHIVSGPIFVNRKGMPLSRNSIWVRMKRLCQKAGVAAAKVFPHNLRKLFARTFYEMGKDIVKLADVLGHSNIDTTRIYIMTTGSEHRRQLNRLGLIL